MILPFSFWQYRLKLMTPIMTSNTAPSGTVSSSNNDVNAFTAFNTSQLDGWASPAAGGDWIQYKFANPTTITRVFMTVATTAGTQTLRFAGSNDGSTFTTLANYVTNGIINTDTMNFANNNSYLFYRFTVVNAASVTFDVIQMYGF